MHLPARFVADFLARPLPPAGVLCWLQVVRNAIAEHGETEWEPEKYLAIDYVPECVGNRKALRAEAAATSSSA